MNFDLRECTQAQVIELCSRFHGYGGAGNTSVYSFGVFEDGRIVAAYSWLPPAFGAAKSVCPEAPWAVLALSRMVAVPKADRKLRHVSRPLRAQMKTLIDRGRWPVLVTYSDEGQGHTGHVYKCSGWEKTIISERPTFETPEGVRTSTYCAGVHRTAGLIRGDNTTIQRWEHWACERGGGCVSHEAARMGAGQVRVEDVAKWSTGARSGVAASAIGLERAMTPTDYLLVTIAACLLLITAVEIRLRRQDAERRRRERRRDYEIIRRRAVRERRRR